MIAVAPSHRAGLLGPIARLLILSTWAWSPQPLPAAEPHQYAFESIAVPAATADEPRRASVSTSLAIDHLEQGSVAWSGQRRCISCHTNGSYMLARPALTAALGTPPASTLDFFREQLQSLTAEPHEALRKSTKPAQVIYLAAGLAEWDRHVTGTLSADTDKALRLMFAIQEDSGTWGTLDCWPPYESDAYHEATVAALAAATAPGWLSATEAGSDDDLKGRIARLRTYLHDTPPPHDYGRVLLLQASTRFPGLIDAAGTAEIAAMIRRHQRDDGGWSIRTFATPESWGRGNRADKLRAEPDFETPASDGHMTGLAILALREAGVPADDEGINRGIEWLQANQRASGRWWTRSLNTDSWHFITYSGTALPLLALQSCGALPAME
jgi:squalene-hopene/tetraprenyl-beta-curcumene cyclase